MNDNMKDLFCIIGVIILGMISIGCFVGLTNMVGLEKTRVKQLEQQLSIQVRDIHMKGFVAGALWVKSENPFPSNVVDLALVLDAEKEARERWESKTENN